ARDAEEVLLGLLDTLGDRRGHLLGLAVPDADGAVAVPHHDERGEAEPATTLDDLGDAVDGHHALQVLVAVVLAAAAAVVAVAGVQAVAAATASGAGVVAGASTLEVSHQTFLFCT